MNRYKYIDSYKKPSWRKINAIKPGQIWKDKKHDYYIKIIERYRWEEGGE